ncbi:hypothetical protein [Vibrio phage BONAISHI]|nr:hypothetical protein [Vibrio phage BONAISHI]
MSNNKALIARIKHTLVFIKDANGFVQNSREIIKSIFESESVDNSTLWSDLQKLLRILIHGDADPAVAQVLGPVLSGLKGKGDNKVEAIERLIQLMEMTKSYEGETVVSNLTAALYQVLLEIKPMYEPKPKTIKPKTERPKPQKVKECKTDKVLKKKIEEATPDSKDYLKAWTTEPGKKPEPEPEVELPVDNDMLLDDADGDFEDTDYDAVSKIPERMSRGQRKACDESRRRIEALKEIRQLGLTIEEAKEAGLL